MRSMLSMLSCRRGGLRAGVACLLALSSCTDMGDLVLDASDASDASDAVAADGATTDSSADTAAPTDASADSTGKIWEVKVGDATVTDGGTAAKVYLPSTLTIAVGDTVRWTWALDGHNVVSGDPDTCTPDLKFCSPSDTTCNKPPVSATGTVYTHAFTEKGIFKYYCRPHCGDGMTGTITVQ